jgi:hypothetical protein
VPKKIRFRVLVREIWWRLTGMLLVWYCKYSVYWTSEPSSDNQTNYYSWFWLGVIIDQLILSFRSSSSAFSLYTGGNAYVTAFDFPPFRWPHSVFEEGACLGQRFLVAATHPSRTWASGSFKSVYDRMRVTQTRPRVNVPSERREHHQPQVIGRLIREKISLPSPGLEPGSPALESSMLTTPPLARSCPSDDLDGRTGLDRDPAKVVLQVQWHPGEHLGPSTQPQASQH